MPVQPARPPASQFDTIQDAPRWGGYWGTADRDLLIGTEAGEEFTGEGGHDFIDAGGGDDRIHAGAGDDTVLAGAGNDFITGDDGNDWLEAGSGQDTIYAGAGNDTLSGGAGDGDVLSGGNGADTYVFRRGDGRDSIEGFYRTDGDQLDLTDFASVLGDINSFAKLKAAGRVTGTDQWGGDTIIRLTNTDQVTLRWVNPRDLTDDQFVFAAAPKNRAPTDILLSAAGIAENAAPGTVVGTLSAVDPDAGDTVRFALLDDAGGAFALAEDGRTLLAVRSFDYEAGPARYAVMVRATDAGGLTTDTVLTIAVLNVDEAVTAEADRYAAVEDTVLTVSAEEGVLANDRAPDGGRAALAGTITTALGGTVDLAADGSFTYTPKANANGRDGFTYTLIDADGSTATGAVTLDVAAVQDPIAPIQLSDVTAGKGGFKIIGETRYDRVGQSLSDAGDVNGDGFADILVGVRNNAGGAAYVVFGKENSAIVDLKDVAAGKGGFKITDGNQGRMGWSVSAAGDIDGDGRADLLIGNPGNGIKGTNEPGSGPGAAYLIFGKDDGTPIDVSDIAADKRGFKISGEKREDEAGLSVAVLGDTNGDGRSDMLIGAPGFAADSKSIGAAYIVFGKQDALPTELKEIADGNGGYKIIGDDGNSRLGFSLAGGGDFNGDDLADFIISDLFSGAAYVIFGKEDTKSISLADVAAGKGGIKIVNGEFSSAFGSAVSAAGDVNGDGLADFIIGAPESSPAAVRSGSAYVVFGKSETTPIDLEDVNAGNGGFKIIGGSKREYAGWSVSGAGDINGDGLADLIIGTKIIAPDRHPLATYIVFGKADASEVNLRDVAAGLGGIKLIADSSYWDNRSSVSAAGDVNGDGFADIAIGNHSISGSGVHILFGSQSWQA